MKLLFGLLLVGISLLAPLSAQDAAASATEVKHVNGVQAKVIIDESAAAVAKGKQPTLTVLDIRTPDEYGAGHIANAKNVNFRAPDFEQEVGKLDKTKTYLVHCAGGNRSKASLEIFKKLGFKTILHLDGGMSGWTKESYPVVK